MKRSVCSQLMLVVLLFVLQSQSILLINSEAVEYSSLEERSYIPNAHISDQSKQQQFHNTNDQQRHHHNHHHHHQQQQQHQQYALLHSEETYYDPEQQQFGSIIHNHLQVPQQQQQQQYLNHHHHEQLHGRQETNQHPQGHHIHNNQQQRQQQQPNLPHQSTQELLESKQVLQHYHLQQLPAQQNQGLPHLSQDGHHQIHQTHEDQSQAHSMQQVLLENSGQQYHYARTHYEWKRQITQDGGLSETIVQNYEASSFPAQSPEQAAYYRQSYQVVHHQDQQYQYQSHRVTYLQQSDEDSHEHALVDLLNHPSLHQPSGYCNSFDNPSSLMQPNLAEPTCRAAPPLDDTAPQDSARNVPNFKPSHNSNVEAYPLAAHHYNYENSLLGAIRHYWREVSGLCLASAIFLNWLFVVVKRRIIASGLTRAEHAIESIQHATTTRSISKDTNSSSAHDSAFEENIPPVGLDDNGESSSSSRESSYSRDRKDRNKLAPLHIVQSNSSNGINGVASNSLSATPTTIRQRSATLRASEPIPIPSSPGHNSLNNSLSNGLSSSEYISRYLQDFDSIQRLGRGGFGIVFEARNKIDDCHYAVKRICLPLEKEARERVMREVRALAKLDHAGIVRYYNAWTETPPDDWLKQHDAQLGIVHSKDGMSFPSTDGIYERNESEQLTKNGSYGKSLGESGDNSVSGCLFSNSPFKRRANGYRKFLKNNSSSPSLDIVFEGSGSIRLEAENSTLETSSNNHDDVYIKHKKKKRSILKNKNGDNNSDSEDSDFIQFESKSNEKNASTSAYATTSTTGDRSLDDGDDDDDISISSHLTEPFSSSSSDNDDSDSESNCNKGEINDADIDNEDVINKLAKAAAKAAKIKDATTAAATGSIRGVDKKNALIYQKELRLSMSENLHLEKAYLYIQMQLCRKDTLKDWLKTNCENRDKTTIFDLFYQIVDAVEYVHSQDLIHRDLKPSNIFFSLDGTLKIGDFGLCRAKASTGIGSSLDLQEYVAESEVERSFGAVHTEQVGTQLYMSPEQLNGLSYNQKVDIFAMGLILLELLIPFKTQMQRVNVLFKARNNLYSEEFRSEHPKEFDFVKTLLSRSPQKRPTASEIKQHELLASAQLSQPVIERIYHRRRTISSNSSTE